MSHVLRLTLCAVFQQGLGHLEPQRAALSRRLPCDLQTLRRTSAVKYDCVDHSQIIPEQKHTYSEEKHIYFKANVWLICVLMGWFTPHTVMVRYKYTQLLQPCLVPLKKSCHHLTMRREETLWLLMGVNLTLKDLTSPGSRRRLYTKGRVDPSTKPVLLFIRDVCQTNKQSAC